MTNNKTEIISIVPLRKESKGIKNKNLRKINGIPLYKYTVNQALRISHKCILTTDIEEVFESERDSNLIKIKRPKNLCQDSSLMSDVIMHSIKKLNLRNNLIILLQATSPLRLDSDILEGLNLFKKGSFSMVMSVSIKESNSLKYGFLNNNKFSSVNEPKFCFANRQQLPNLYAPNGAVYIFGSNSFIENKDFPTSSIGAFEMPVSRSIDIDKESDLEIIKKLNLNYDYGKK